MGLHLGVEVCTSRGEGLSQAGIEVGSDRSSMQLARSSSLCQLINGYGQRKTLGPMAMEHQ
jgi:hypothetical protein